MTMCQPRYSRPLDTSCLLSYFNGRIRIGCTEEKRKCSVSLPRLLARPVSSGGAVPAASLIVAARWMTRLITGLISDSLRCLSFTVDGTSLCWWTRCWIGLKKKESYVEVIRVEKLELSEHCDFYWAAEAVEWVYESLREDIEKTRPRFPEEIAS